MQENTMSANEIKTMNYVKDIHDGLFLNPNLMANDTFAFDRDEFINCLTSYVDFNRDIDLSFIAGKIGDVHFESAKENDSENFRYDSINNIVYMKEEFMGDEYTNKSSVYFQIMLDMIHNCGIEEEHYSVISKGIRESIANGFVGDISTDIYAPITTSYLDVQFFSGFVDIDLMIEAYQTGESQKLTKALINANLFDSNEMMEYANITPNEENKNKITEAVFRDLRERNKDLREYIITGIEPVNINDYLVNNNLEENINLGKSK